MCQYSAGLHTGLLLKEENFTHNAHKKLLPLIFMLKLQQFTTRTSKFLCIFCNFNHNLMQYNQSTYLLSIFYDYYWGDGTQAGSGKSQGPHVKPCSVVPYFKTIQHTCTCVCVVQLVFTLHVTVSLMQYYTSDTVLYFVFLQIQQNPLFYKSDVRLPFMLKDS